MTRSRETTELSLPERMFLLAYDREKHKLTARSQLGCVLRAAALAQLALDGTVRDENGRPAVAGTPSPGTDTDLVAAVAAEVAEGRRRRWQSWVGRREGQAVRMVRTALADKGWIRVEERRVLGLFPAHRVELREPLPVRRMADAAVAAMRGSQPVHRVAAVDAAAAALAGAGEVPTVADRRARRAYKRRLQELEERTGPAAPALRKALQAKRAAAASSGG